MPYAMTYSSLVTTLQQYLQRYDSLVVDKIPLFIMLAQQRIPREMKILGFREEVTGIFNGNAQSSGLMAKPSDWRKTIGFWVGVGNNNNTHSPVYDRTYEYIRTVYPDPSIQGTPRFYGDANWNYWLLGPSPDQAYPFKVAYYGTLTFLDNTTQTNWLTTNAPDLLLYACLMEAVPFVKADERIPVWEAAYAAAKAALQAQELEGLFDKQALTQEPQPPAGVPIGR